MDEWQGRRRVIIEGVTPEIDCGEFPIKRVVGEKVVVEADIFAEGHDVLTAVLRYGPEGGPELAEAPMQPLGNDRWQGEFTVQELGGYRYTVQAWVDSFMTWARDLRVRVDAGQDVGVQLLIGARLVEEAVRRASPGASALRARVAGPGSLLAAAKGQRADAAAGEADAERLAAYARALAAVGEEGVRQALSPDLAALMRRYPDRQHATSYVRELSVTVDPVRARTGAWYELFPRSCSPEPGRHGTFRDVEARLPYVAAMGFDVLYLPPIHPIGRSYRKGRNNRVQSDPGDPGSPWAIGAAEGGHTAVHPELGTLDDFRRLVDSARRHGLEMALDLAFQTSPDHPWVHEHPEWFRRRPDNTIQYAENPPKRYQDVYPLDFDTEDWQSLWAALKDVTEFWIEQGVQIFRVDNPHTKPFAFWRWLIPEIKRRYPGVIFLAEAFTRPKVMKRLAKLGFTQSYTYFTWRNTRGEIEQYFTELTKTEMREYYRPNLWPNTPDILHEYLQLGGRPAFGVRLMLAATLGATYGIYGPAFELGVNQPAAPGSEEYLDSEKFEVKHWDLEQPSRLRDLIARVNAIRRDNPALQSDWSLQFHAVDDDQLLCYSKHTEDLSNVIVVVINLDPHHARAGYVQLPLAALGIDTTRAYQAHDLLSDERYLWNGPRNYVRLDPAVAPAHIFRIRRHLRTEHDFDYYM